MKTVTTNFTLYLYAILMALLVSFQTSFAQDGLTSTKYNIQNVRISNDRLTISYDVYIQDIDNSNLVAIPGFIFRLAVPQSDLGSNAKTVTVTNASSQLGATGVYMVVRDNNWVMQFTNSIFVASYNSAFIPSEVFPGTLLGTYNISNTDGTQFANPQVLNLNYSGNSPLLKSTISLFNPYTTTLAPNSTAALPTTSFSGLQNYSLTTPVSCPAPSVLSTSSISNSGVQINWVANTSVQSYRVYWKSSIGDSTWQNSPLLSNTINSFSITSLSANTLYSYFVASICADQSLNSSAQFSFSTASDLPSVPVLTSPANTTTGIPTNPTLAWNAATNATSYRVQLSTSNTFSPIVANEVVSSTSKALTGLANGTTYYWRVCSKNATDSSAWSSAWSFTTVPAALAVPTLSSPANTSTGIPTNPTLAWNATTNATSYRVQVSTLNSFSLILKNEVVSTTSKSIAGLANGTTYYWRVCSKTATDSSAWSSAWSFTTVPAAPAVPTLSSPANTSTGIPTNPSLAWNAATNATSYRVQVSTSNAFSLILKNEVVSTTSKSIAGLANGTTYYWRVCSKTATDSSAWSSAWSFTTSNYNIAPVPVSWTPTENTGTTANIGLISTGTFTVDGRPFQNGDAIGAFYLDGSQRKCAGYLLWNSSTYGFVVWGDDEFTNSVKEGFANGEAFTFKVWNSLTAQEATYVNITYQSGNQTFASNGLTFISAVSALTQITQNIPLANGWNMISSYVMPANDTLSNTVAPISNSLVIIKDAFGRSLWPGFMNNLTKWDYKNAYVTKVTAACSLSITGQKIIPENMPWLMNNTGWYWIPYYRTTSMNTLEAIASVNANYRIIKSINGQSYWPGFMTTLTQLEPGKGYMIYMNAADTLLYPSNPTAGRIAPSVQAAEPQFFALEPKNTGNTANIALLFDSKYDGSEVGVFSSNNELIGSAVVANGKAGVAVWGDDAMTSIVEGAVESEILTFKLYDTKTNSTKEIELTNILDIVENANRDDVAYTTDGIFMATALVKEMVSADDATLGSDLQVIPNPVVEISTVKYAVGDGESFVLELFSLDGNKVATLANGSAPAGVYSAVIDSKELASGVYTLVFKSGTKHISKQIVVVK